MIGAVLGCVGITIYLTGVQQTAENIFNQSFLYPCIIFSIVNVIGISWMLIYNNKMNVRI
jgi:hypothetical protein